MTPVAPLVLLVAGVAFEIFCLVKVFTVPVVRRLPRWAWAVLCACCNPLGGAAFVVLGWQRRA